VFIYFFKLALITQRYYEHISPFLDITKAYKTICMILNDLSSGDLDSVVLVQAAPVGLFGFASIVTETNLLRNQLINLLGRTYQTTLNSSENRF